MKLRTLALSLLSATALTIGCGDASNTAANNATPSTNNNNNGGVTLEKPDGSACGLAGRTGTTTCEGAVGGSCQAGQYCDFLMCVVGCNSDNNCANNQYCDIPAEGVGTCRNCIRVEPMPNPNPNPNPNPMPSGKCEAGAAELRTCDLVTAAEAAGFITLCNDGQSDPDEKQIFDAVLTCIDIAKDCTEMDECAGEDPGPGPDPGQNDCAAASAKATTCSLFDAAEAGAFVADCQAKNAANLLDELAFCLSNSPTCDAAELCLPF